MIYDIVEVMLVLCVGMLTPIAIILGIVVYWVFSTSPWGAKQIIRLSHLNTTGEYCVECGNPLVKITERAGYRLSDGTALWADVIHCVYQCDTRATGQVGGVYTKEEK